MSDAIYTTYDNQAIHEDMRDVIYDVSPKATPFLSMIAGTGANAASRTHEWNTDVLDAPNKDNARVEGEDKVTEAITAPTRLTNYTQISDKKYKISGTHRSVDTVDSDDELIRQRVRKGEELKRDLETILLENTGKVAGDNSTARKLGSISSWLKTNTSFDGTTGADPVGDGSNARTDSSATRNFTEALFQDVTGSIFTNSGEAPNYALMRPKQKRIYSDFQGRTDQLRDVSKTEVQAAIDVYFDDFDFAITAITERFMRDRDVFILTSDFWEVCFLPNREFTVEALAKLGDAEREQQICEYTLVSKNEAASGGVFDLT